MTALVQMDDVTIYQEMLTHPPLFSHNLPERILIYGDVNCKLLEEVMKHHTATEIWEITEYSAAEPPIDPRVIYHSLLPELPIHYFDIMIIAEKSQEDSFGCYFDALRPQGILVQIGESPFHVNLLREIQVNLQLAGFRDTHIISFPQPGFDTGWRAAFMAKKNGIFTRVREKAIFNKTFSTRYYNLDIHKAALVLPEFIREALTF